MDLILWRHAEAVEGDAGEDLARKLTSKGERQAERMAEWLNRRLCPFHPRPGQPGGALPGDGQGAGPQVPHGRASSRPGGERRRRCSTPRAGPRRSEPVLIVGHQPTLGLAAAQALIGVAQPWSIKKGAVWWIRHRPRDDEDRVVLQAVQSPDCL